MLTDLRRGPTRRRGISVFGGKNGLAAEIDLNDEAWRIIAKREERGEYVFCHKNGNPYKLNLQDFFKRAADRAGVALPPRKAWHILKRTWSSMSFESGGDVETLWEDGTFNRLSQAFPSPPLPVVRGGWIHGETDPMHLVMLRRLPSWKNLPDFFHRNHKKPLNMRKNEHSEKNN